MPNTTDFDFERVDFSRITQDPDVMGGKPCIRGLRVTVSTILGLLAASRTQDEILQAYPYLEREDIQTALAYAAREIDAPLDRDPVWGNEESWEEFYTATPDAHKKLLDERLAEADANPDDSVPWEQVREDLQAKLRRPK